ncbi:MAG: CBS domain-containing protein [Synergistaceae bacterium]|nr:CBS domain-containing protein [Synergistaceae bacterium]
MILVTSHIGSDFDSLASMVAAAKLYDGAVLSFSGSAGRTVREFLKRFPGRWEVLTPRKITMADVDLLVVVDARSRSRIGAFAPLLDRPGLKVHLYDHHPPAQDEIEAEKRVIEPVGAVATLLVEILLREGIPISPQEATLFVMGIYEDTGALTFGSTCRRDFEAVARLRELGADMTLIPLHVEMALSAPERRLQDQLVDHGWERYVNGARVVLSTLSLDHYVEGLSLFVHRLRDYFDADVALAAVTMEKRTYVVGRSREGVLDMAAFLAPLGGGGHAQAASVTLTGVDPAEVLQDLEKALETAIGPSLLVRDIMTRPVMAVESSISLDEAYRVMIRYGHAALPVTAGGRIKGIITRKDLDKAKLHGLGQVSVAEYMTEGVISVRPEAHLAEAHRMMVAHNIGRLPVVLDGQLQGIVTRTDMLRALYPASLPLEERHFGNDYPWQEDLTDLMARRLPTETNHLLRRLGHMADAMGMKAFAVGGFVRDLLLGKINLDLDVVIEGDGVAFIKAWEGEGYRVSVHERFRTGTIHFPGSLKVDVATARREFYEYPVAQPTVASDSLKHDLYRRDFTVNAMAVALCEERWGQLIDYFGGRRDLRRGFLKVLHNLSFVEDPTRVFRGVRLEQRLRLRLEDNTARLMKSCVKGGLLSLLSGLRVKSELEILFSEAAPLPALRRLREFGAWDVLFPGISADQETDRIVRRLAVFFRRLSHDLPSFNDELWLVYLAALLFGSDETIQRSVMDRLHLAPRERRVVETSLFSHRSAENDLGGRAEKRVSEIWTYLQGVPLTACLFWAAATDRWRVRRRLLHYLTRWHKVHPMLSGQEVLDLGYREGPQIGRILSGLRSARLDGAVETREEEIQWILDNFPKGAKRK